MKYQNKTIAIVDDEPDILELVEINLIKSGFKTETFLEASSFYEYIDKKTPDLLILDLMLPDADGIEICKFLKKGDRFSTMPIIILTAKNEEIDRVITFELGVDDYITKPFYPRELVARVKAVLRRVYNEKVEDRITIGGILEIDAQKYKVTSEGLKIDLTPTEFKILHLLSGNIGYVFSRNKILDYINDGEKRVLPRTIDVHIRNLRDKLGRSGRFIKNVRTIGYKIEDEK